MKLEWFENQLDAEIGIHKLHILDDNDKTINGSEITLWDYTCDYQVNARKNIWPPHRKEIAFLFNWCNGWSHEETFMKNEGMTLEKVKKKAEEWLFKMFEGRLNSVKKQIKELEPIVSYLRDLRENSDLESEEEEK